MPSPLLVVDDDPLVRKVLVSTLERWGCSAVEAADGMEALEWLRANPAPSLILLDLHMPKMNGWVFCYWQQNDPLLAQIPIVVMSGQTEPEPAAEFLKARDHLRKPVEIERLEALVRRYCSDAPDE